MCTDHVNSTPTLSATVYSMPILFFPLFLIFSLNLHYLPYWKMHTDHVNNIPTLLTMVYIIYLYFFRIFSDFRAIFTLITILGNAHRPCQLYLNIINNFTSCLSFFSWFFPDFLIVFTLLTILGNAHRPCLHLLSLHNNLTTKVYMVQKKPCDLDHNWQSYIETFIFAKNDD